MADFNQTDIDKRVQLAYCCIADLGDIVRKDLLYGRKCLKQNFRKLKYAISLLESVCNQVALEDTTTVGTGIITLTGTAGTVAIFANGMPISGSVSFNGNLITTASDVATAINAYAAPINFTASHTLGTARVTISEPTTDPGVATGFRLTSTASVDMGINGSGFTGIISGGLAETTEDDNRLSEEDMQNIFEKLSSICSDCYKNPGYSY